MRFSFLSMQVLNIAPYFRVDDVVSGKVPGDFVQREGYRLWVVREALEDGKADKGFGWPYGRGRGQRDCWGGRKDD